MSQERTPHTIRFPADLHERLREAARKSGRDFNGEVVRRLERSLAGDDVLTILLDQIEAERVRINGNTRGAAALTSALASEMPRATP